MEESEESKVGKERDERKEGRKDRKAVRTEEGGRKGKEEGGQR